MFQRIRSWLGTAPESDKADDARAAIRAALHRYPAHAPPHPGHARDLTPEQAQANLNWVLATLPERLQVLDGLLTEFGVPTRPAADTPEGRQAWVGQLIDWTRRCWPAQPYRPEHLDKDVWLKVARIGDDAIFSVTLDLATLMGEVIKSACPAWRWGLDMASANMGGQPMLTARRVVMTTAPLGSKGIRVIRDWEAAIVAHYWHLDPLERGGPLTSHPLFSRFMDACSGRVVRHFDNA